MSDYNGEMVSEAVMGEIIRLQQRNADLERAARYQVRCIVSLVRQLEALAAKWDETAARYQVREMTPRTTGLPEALVGRSSGIAECARQLRAVIGQPPQEGEDGD